MRSAHNVHPEFGLSSHLRRKAGAAVAFIVCGSIADASTRFRIAVQFTASRAAPRNSHSGDNVDKGTDDSAFRTACGCFQEVAKSGSQREPAPPRLV